MLGKLGETILEWVYPSDLYCLRCGTAVERGSEFTLCETCRRELRWVGDACCHRCGKPMGQAPDGDPKLRRPHLCGDCRRGRVIRKGYISLVYDGPEREMIHRFKFEGRPYYGDALASMMARRLDGKIGEDFLVIPVPMHEKKRRQRGYDQAVILAEALAKKRNLPFCKDVLVRVRLTDPMMRLAGDDRVQNVAEAFQITSSGFSKIQGKAILLVDDIYTSGSTADACAKVLLSAGAGKIYLAAAASGYGSWV